jgi:predicted MFS family arabinose efflux permease
VVDRRLLVLVCAVVGVETIFFAALTPLLPKLEREFHLSTTGVGVLGGAYPAGGTIGALGGAWLTTRAGVRTTTVVGMALLAVCCAGFGFADRVWLLDALRFAQGTGAAIAWTGALAWLAAAAPPERRGELLGIALGAAVSGALLGPLVGGAADLVGRPLAFATVATLGGVLIACALRMPAPHRAPSQPLRLVVSALRRPSVAAGAWLIALPALLFGCLSVLGPLRLDAAGVGTLGMTLFWAASAAVGAVQSPLLGRWSDRRGRLEPVRAGLVVSIAISIAIPFSDGRAAAIALVLAASVVYNSFWVPGGALLAEAGEAQGLAHGLSFALFNLSWAPAGAIGSIAGASLADSLGTASSYLVLAALCALTALVITPRRTAIATA